ncbi:hypothetical protein GCM10007160_18130 [Litchfieldella qijiaojingensis]|uniref:DNA primase/helicase n=1 Tax=Litchfieldella qijiaojingensis TaxID=980347 RepID=A0ABQ2YQH4_9GAMM|nr:DnaB-like helicase C-terminal domain-containing protein [Halomonas qijiaojingensis]GGX91033.1 hypothetical protein GCM10007160_18130 [Halomonas qijiaojingensis]
MSKKPLVTDGEVIPLRKRKITEETCKKFGYFLGEQFGKKVQVAPYRDQSGKVTAQKLRFPDKKFRTTGDFDAENLQLFGQHLWPSSGKRVVITEGEIDCLSVSQAQGNKWPVVSLPSGAQSYSDPIRANLEWLSTFEEVVLLFDMDEAGQENVKKAAELFKPGQAKIAKLPLKDPNEMLVAGRDKELIAALWNAEEFRPDGLVEIDDILDQIEKPVEWGLPWCFPTLTQYTYGRRYGEVYGFGAGTGIGKTDLFTQQIEHDITQLKMKVGVVYLEQMPAETGTRIAGKLARKQFHIPDGDWTVEERREAVAKLKGKVTFYDSFGQTEWDVVANKIRYMVTGLGIRLIFLDHLTAMVDTANEKESLEQIMKEMAGLAKELGCIIHFISHLSTPEGKPHEEGGRVMIRHFKGSRSIGFWSYYMFGLERDQQAEDPEEAQTTTFRILKDRYTGQATGKTIPLGYDAETGMLFEKSPATADDYGFGQEDDAPPWEGKSDF